MGSYRRGSSVIDYIIENDRATGKMKLVKEGNRTESNNISLKVELIGLQTRKRKKSHW